MDAGQSFKITVLVERRPDGGLRAWSDDVPNLVLSHRDEDRVLTDLEPALETILSDIMGCQIKIERLPSFEMIKRGLAQEEAARQHAEATKRKPRPWRSPPASKRKERWEYFAHPCVAP